MPKVSVIVPVYKAEKYLHRCVDSILAQTFKDFELLLIDDGSPDRSGEICDEYAQKDNRIRVFHKENGGVSSARQKGMDEAVGEYTIHADPDDWVEPTMLEELYRKAKEDDADMVICDFYRNTVNVQEYVRQQPSALDHKTVLRELFQQLHGSCWNKLVSRVCYKKYGLEFVEWMSFCEDLFLNARLLLNPIKVAYLPKAFYHYDQTENNNSIVRRYSMKAYEYDKRLSDLFNTTFKGTDVERAVELNCIRLRLTRAFWGNIFTSKEFKSNFYRYRNDVRLCIPSRYLWVCYYLSCLGLYGVIYKLMGRLLAIINTFK